MEILDTALDTLKGKLEKAYIEGDVGGSERIVSAIAGGFVLSNGIKNILHRPVGAVATIGLGLALLARAATGKCVVKGLVGKKDKAAKLTVIEHRYFVK